MQKNAKTVNLSLQVLPLNHPDSYPLIREAIRVIEASGVKHRVQPFSTVMEGPMDVLWPVVEKARKAVEKAGGREVILNIQIHTKASDDVRFEDKTGVLRPLVVIPARYASVRFPGKPLALLGDKPVIQRVWEQVKMAGDDFEVIVATDDERILTEVERFGGCAELTDASHLSGTDRCAEVAARHSKYGVIINVQGDEPFIRPEQVRTVIDLLQMQKFSIATLAKPIYDATHLSNPNVVKVVVGQASQALYFSRHPIPYLRDNTPDTWIDSGRHLQHLGIYGFRRDTLLEINQLPESPLETAEKLEQLRWLDHGYRIGVGMTDWSGPGIDTPDNLKEAGEFLGRSADGV
jgi:3-deoxy-manno-octulosonate cytidylyltransferase (CMP-KDO synthetase)